MAPSVLVGYATRYGSTREVAESIATVLSEQGLAAGALPLRAVRGIEGYDAVVVGAPLYMFRWHRDALRLLARHQQALRERPVALFALGPTHEPHDEPEWQNAAAQMDRALSGFPWLRPVALRIFGGRFDPALLRFPVRQLAGSAPATDLRDWEAIRAWAADLATRL